MNITMRSFVGFVLISFIFISCVFSESELYGFSTGGGVLFKINATTFELQQLKENLITDGRLAMDNVNGVIYLLNFTGSRDLTHFITGYHVDSGKISVLDLPPRQYGTAGNIVFDPKANEVVYLEIMTERDLYRSMSRIDPTTNTWKTSPDFRADFFGPYTALTYDYTKDMFYAYVTNNRDYLTGMDGVTGKDIIHVSASIYHSLDYDPKTGLVFGVFKGLLFGQQHVVSWKPETGEIKPILTLSLPTNRDSNCYGSLDPKARLLYMSCTSTTSDSRTILIVDVDAGKLIHESPPCKAPAWCPDQIVIHYH